MRKMRWNWFAVKNHSSFDICQIVFELGRYFCTAASSTFTKFHQTISTSAQTLVMYIIHVKWKKNARNALKFILREKNSYLAGHSDIWPIALKQKNKHRTVGFNICSKFEWPSLETNKMPMVNAKCKKATQKRRLRNFWKFKNNFFIKIQYRPLKTDSYANRKKMEGSRQKLRN